MHGQVSAGRLMMPEPVEDDHVQRPIGLPVPAAVEAVVTGPTRGSLHRADSAQPGERGFGADLLGIVPSGDQKLRGGFGAEPRPAAHAGGEQLSQPVQIAVGGGDLGGQLGDADREPAQAPFRINYRS